METPDVNLLRRRVTTCRPALGWLVRGAAMLRRETLRRRVMLLRARTVAARLKFAGSSIDRPMAEIIINNLPSEMRNIGASLALAQYINSSGIVLKLLNAAKISSSNKIGGQSAPVVSSR